MNLCKCASGHSYLDISDDMSSDSSHSSPDRSEGVQVPFFATHEAKRKRGYGRALVEAIEEVGELLLPMSVHTAIWRTS